MNKNPLNLKKSTSNMLNYINLLMGDDDALKSYLADPITNSEEKNGLTKAERAVLRRSVTHLSNNALNGYSINRDLSSYRRSLRLIQNVLHNTGSKMIADYNTTDDTVGTYTQVQFYLPQYYYLYDFTKKTNTDIGNPYEYGPYTYGTYLNGSQTIQQLMDAVTPNNFTYETVTIGESVYLKSVTLFGTTYTADLSQYQLTDDYVFWFYSINGTANTGAATGTAGESFANYTVNPGDIVTWQVIAPDAQYGFLPCAPGTGNSFAEAKKVAT